MKKILLSLLLLVSFNVASAVDRVVQQGGPVGTYGSISAAITAAVDGDNIVINNRTDLLPWIENLTVAKSLTFISAVDNVQWWMEGSITITMADNREVNFVGMRNTLTTSVTRTGVAPANRTRVSFVNCDLTNVNITMGTSGVNLLLSSSKARDVSFSYGRVFGCDLRSLQVDADAVATEDVIQIVGNRIGINLTPASYGLVWGSNTQYIFLSNNYVKSFNQSACFIGQMKVGAGTNKIINCTISCQSTAFTSNGYAGLFISYSGLGVLAVENCILGGNYFNSSQGACGVYVGVGNVTFTYNLYYNPYSCFTPSSTLNNFSSAVGNPGNIGGLGNILVAGSVDAGSPANSDLDLDLTRNDVGCYGGSYSLDNFLPFMSNPQSSRVSFVTTPRVVNQGGTVNVTATGFDK